VADQSAAVSGYGVLFHDPGNPALPTLPGANDPSVGYLDEFGLGADFTFFDEPLPPEPYRTSATTPGEFGGYAGWFLNKVWATPAPIDFGDIADQKDVAVTLYSTFRDPKELSSVVIPTAGVTLFDPALPVNLPSMGDEVLTFRAAQTGPQEFDDEVTFTVEALTFVIRTIGRRVLLMISDPQAGAQEQLTFVTDLMRSKNGLEQAFSTRRGPRTIVNYNFRFSSDNDKKRTELETIIFGGNPILPIGVQLWWEGRKISAAALSTDIVVNFTIANMSIAAGDTLIFNTPDGTEIISTILMINSPEIGVTLEQAVGTDLPLGTWVTPVRFGHLLQPARISTAQKNLEDLSVQFTLESERDIGEVDPNYFDFHTVESPARPILRERCAIRKLTGAISREQTTIDSKTGRIFVTGTEPLGEWSSQVVVFCDDVSEMYAWRKFIHYMRGSWGTFYAPTFQNDLPLFSPLTLGGNTFIVPFMGIENLLNGAAPKRDLRIVTVEGVVYYRRITNVTDNGNGTETITVNSVIGSGSPAFSPISQTVISWMHLVRIGGDSATFKHRSTLGDADLTFTVRTVKE